MTESAISKRLGVLLAACGMLMLASEEASAQSIECCPRGSIDVSALEIPCDVTIFALYDDGHREYFVISGGRENNFPCYNKMIGVFIVDCNGKPVEITLSGVTQVTVAPGCCLHVGVKFDEDDCPHIYFFPLPAERCEECPR